MKKDSKLSNCQNPFDVCKWYIISNTIYVLYGIPTHFNFHTKRWMPESCYLHAKNNKERRGESEVSNTKKQ